MDSLKRRLFVFCLCCKVIQTSSWTAVVPLSVKGLLGSCVVIPCSYDYPSPGKSVGAFTGMWLDGAHHQLIYHPDVSKTMAQYRNRTELLGDVTQNNCSLKIDPLKESDRGPFYFRIEMADHEKYSYKQNTASITVIGEPNALSLTVKKEVVEGQPVTAACSVTHSCPDSPPAFTWSHSGLRHFQSQQLQDGQWRATSTLIFEPTRADHNRSLECNVTYKGGRHQRRSQVLKVKYAPVKVTVEYRSDVKEGETVQLKCSSEAYPPTSSYEWQNEAGVRLHQGNSYRLLNVSRHTGALYCTAINTVGRGKSKPVHLDVLRAPEIKAISSCSSEADMVKCVCLAESKPPSMVYFVLADRALPRTKVERHGSVTIGTLQQSEFGSSEFISCLANNTQGFATLALFLPVYSKMQTIYIAIAAGAVLILVMLLIGVGVKKWGRSGDAQRSHLSKAKADINVKLPQYAATKRKENRDEVRYPDPYEEVHVYGNMENDSDDAIYANV